MYFSRQSSLFLAKLSITLYNHLYENTCIDRADVSLLMDSKPTGSDIRNSPAPHWVRHAHPESCPGVFFLRFVFAGQS